jgi:hypothetical protein
MKSTLKTTSSLALAAALIAAISATPAAAKPMCGWFAIAYCTKSEDAAFKFSGNGWGAVIKTSKFIGFAPGQFCVVSGPQSKASAIRDRRNAIGNGVSDDVYIKRACADEMDIGDGE